MIDIARITHEIINSLTRNRAYSSLTSQECEAIVRDELTKAGLCTCKVEPVTGEPTKPVKKVVAKKS